MTSIAATQNRTPHYICPPELLPERPLIPGEDAAVWDSFRANMLELLDPGSFLEHELAERVALQLWRFRRANRYEADVATDEFQSARTLSIVNTGYLEPDEPVSKALVQLVEEIEEQATSLAQFQSARELLRQLPNLTNAAQLDPSPVAILTALVGIKDPAQIPNPMTAGVVRRALASWSRRSIPEALKWATDIAEDKCKTMAERLTGMGVQKARLLEDMRHVMASRQRDRTLLPKPALERALRYEAHVSRQLTQALNLLREFKDERLAKEETTRQQPPASEGAEDCTPGSSAPPSADATRSFRNFGDLLTEVVNTARKFGIFDLETASDSSAASEERFYSQISAAQTDEVQPDEEPDATT